MVVSRDVAPSVPEALGDSDLAVFSTWSNRQDGGDCLFSSWAFLSNPAGETCLAPTEPGPEPSIDDDLAEACLPWRHELQEAGCATDQRRSLDGSMNRMSSMPSMPASDAAAVVELVSHRITIEDYDDISLHEDASDAQSAIFAARETPGQRRHSPADHIPALKQCLRRCCTSEDAMKGSDADPRISCSQDQSASVALEGVTVAMDLSIAEATNAAEGDYERLLVLEREKMEVLCRIYAVDAARPCDLPPLPVAPWHEGEEGYLGFLTDAEQEGLEGLRARFPVSVHLHTDHDLLRFLRARDFDPEETAVMYQRFLDEYMGRLQVSPATIVRPIFNYPAERLAVIESLPRRPDAVTERLRLVYNTFIQAAVVGTCTGGRPVIWQRARESLRRRYGHHTSLEDRLLLQTSSQEAVRLMCHMESAARGYCVEDVIMVLDMQGVSPLGMFKHLTSPTTKQESSVGLDYFPETMSKIMIINVPRGCGMLWSVASLLLPPKTKRKIAVVGGNPAKALCTFIGEDNVPTVYGGKLQWEWPEMAPVDPFHQLSTTCPPLSARGPLFQACVSQPTQRPCKVRHDSDGCLSGHPVGQDDDQEPWLSTLTPRMSRQGSSADIVKEPREVARLSGVAVGLVVSDQGGK